MKYTCHFLYVHRLQDKRESKELNNSVERGWTEASFGSQDFEPVQALLSCLGSPAEPAVLLFVSFCSLFVCFHATKHPIIICSRAALEE